MSALKSAVLVGLGFVVLGGAAACSLGSETIVNMSEAAATEDDAGAEATARRKTNAATDVNQGCGGSFAKADLSKAKPCESGGHCWAKAKVPASLQELFVPCDAPGDVCVPDEILTAGGSKLPQCTQPDSVKAVAGAGGGCVTLALLPEVQKQAGAFLKQQECGAGQACVPCTNPQDHSDTPFCEPIGVYADTCGGGGGGGDGGAKATSTTAAAGPPCCSSHGVCMSSTVLPPDKKDAMPRDTCPQDDVCMPAAMMQGKATRCDAGLLFGAGVCLDACFNAMLAIGGFFGVLSSDGCGSPSEICTPCSILKDQMPAGVPVPGCE